MSPQGRYFIGRYSCTFRGNDLIAVGTLENPPDPEAFPRSDIATTLYAWRRADFLGKPTDLSVVAPRRNYQRFAPADEP